MQNRLVGGAHRQRLTITPHNEAGMVTDEPLETEENTEVSELGIDSDLDDDDLDALIQGPSSLNGSRSNRTTTATGLDTSSNGNDSSVLKRDYGEDLPPPTLPSVSEPIAHTVTKWLRMTPGREKIREMFKSIILPANIDGLTPVRINDIVYQTIPFRAKINDQRFRGINSYLTTGVGPLVSILDSLISSEEAILKGTETVQVIDNKITFSGGAILDVLELRQLLHKSVKLLSFCNAVVLQKRRTMIKPFLAHKFQYLTRPSQDISDQLLGKDMETKISDSHKAVEVGKKIRPFFKKQAGGTRGFKSNNRGSHSQTSGFIPGYSYPSKQYRTGNTGTKRYHDGET